MKVYLKAPNNVSVCKNPLGFLLTDTSSHAVEVNPSKLLHAAKILLPQAQLGDADPNLLVWWLDSDDQDSLLYGVDPTGVAFSDAGLRALYRACIAAGGSVAKLPRRGLLKLSATWAIGRPWVNMGDVGYGLGQSSSCRTATSYSDSTYNAGLVDPFVSVEGRGSVLFWGAAEPGSETPLLAHFQAQSETKQAHPEAGFIRDIGFAGPAAFSSLVLQTPDATFAPTTNVSGLFAPGTSAKIERVSARECKRGIFVSDPFWFHLDKATAWHCDIGFELLGTNAGRADHLKASYCKTGYVLSGQGTKYGTLASEQCGSPVAGVNAGSVWVPEADNLTIGTLYLEVTGAVLGWTLRAGLVDQLIENSENLLGAGWSAQSSGTAPTVALSTEKGPDGVMPAYLITFAEAVPDGGHWDYLTQNIPAGANLVAGQTYVLSGFMKAPATGTAATNVHLGVRVGGGAGDAAVICTPGSSWQRFEVSFTPGTGFTNLLLDIGNSGVAPFTLGLGGVLVSGLMLHRGIKAAPYRKSGSAQLAGGNGVFFLKLDGMHGSNQYGRTLDLRYTQLIYDNSRHYDQGDATLRACLDYRSSIKSLGSSLPINPAGLEPGAALQTLDKVAYGMAWIHNMGDADSESIAPGRATHRDLSGYTCMPQDEILVSLPNLPADWLARADCVSNGTIRLTLLNCSGAAGDVPTMGGTFHVRRIGDLA